MKVKPMVMIFICVFLTFFLLTSASLVVFLVFENVRLHDELITYQSLNYEKEAILEKQERLLFLLFKHWQTVFEKEKKKKKRKLKKKNLKYI